jgi:hypothetical protein
MRTLLVGCTLLALALPAARAGEPGFPKFRAQEIAKDLTVGYAVIVADLNGDGKPDIVVVDTNRVVWYENPTWQRRTIIQGMTKPDNVCIAAVDIDGDGQLDLVLGADWHPANTKTGGTLQWLKRGKTLDDPWTVYPIGEEPTVHRVRVADLDGSGKPQIILAPLQGRESSAKGNWVDGRPVRLLAYKVPADPVKGPWVPTVINEELHVVHNIWPVPAGRGPGSDLLAASYEGVTWLTQNDGKWSAHRIGEGNQANPKGSRGSSEIKRGHTRAGDYIATIEPWHGNQVVVYTPPADPKLLWDRHVLDEQLKWGHAVWCADLDGSGDETLVVGVRDTLAEEPGKRRGVRLYRPTDASRTKWVRQVIEDGGVAVEDLTVADLDGDGRPEIIACGRQTGNVRIFWNLGPGDRTKE